MLKSLNVRLWFLKVDAARTNTAILACLDFKPKEIPDEGKWTHQQAGLPFLVFSWFFPQDSYSATRADSLAMGSKCVTLLNACFGRTLFWAALLFHPLTEIPGKWTFWGKLFCLYIRQDVNVPSHCKLYHCQVWIISVPTVCLSWPYKFVRTLLSQPWKEKGPKKKDIRPAWYL